MDIKGFLLRFFAAIGLAIPCLFGLLVWGLWAEGFEAGDKQKDLPETFVLSFDLTESLVEQPAAPSLPSLALSSRETSFFSVVNALRRAKRDPRVKGIVARMGTQTPSLVHAQEIASALADFRKTDKFSFVFAPSYGTFGPDPAFYYLASQFEDIWIQPVGAVGLAGLEIEAPFGKTALKDWGVTGDFLRREEYKSVMENVMEDSFSPAVKDNMQAMLNSLAEQIVQGISLGRKIDPAKAKTLMAQGPYTANEALAAGLVTRIGYEDEMKDEIEKKAGAETETIDFETYLAVTDRQNLEKKKAPKVALIHAQGMIVESAPEGPLGAVESNVIDTQEVVDAFKEAVEDEEIRAVLFRVDSPGGSPVASETIRRAVVLAKKAGKPVFVSMGRVAASGGYWISMDGSRLFADPATITGSIGVVAGKFVLGGLFDKVGLRWDSIKTEDNAGMLSMRAPFSDQARARMNAMIDEIYGDFVKNVAAARKIPLEKVGDVAKGRVFTGQDALKVGLVDQLGGMEVALESLKTELKIPPGDKMALVRLPAPETPQDMIMKVLRNFMGGQVMLGSLARDAAEMSALLKESLGAFTARTGVVLPSFVVLP